MRDVVGSDNDGFLAPACDAFKDKLVLSALAGLDDCEPHFRSAVRTTAVQQRMEPLRVIHLTLPSTRPPSCIVWAL